MTMEFVLTKTWCVMERMTVGMTVTRTSQCAVCYTFGMNHMTKKL